MVCFTMPSPAQPTIPHPLHDDQLQSCRQKLVSLRMDRLIARQYPACFCIFNRQRMAMVGGGVSILETISPRFRGGLTIVFVAGILTSLGHLNAPIFVLSKSITRGKLEQDVGPYASLSLH